MKKLLITSVVVMIPAIILIAVSHPYWIKANAITNTSMITNSNTAVNQYSQAIAQTNVSIKTSQIIHKTTNIKNQINIASQPGPGTYYVFVEPDSYFKNPGSWLMFTGNHFYPNEIVTVTMGKQMLGTIGVDANGNLESGWFQVPYTLGNYTYTFKGNISNIAFPVTVKVGGMQPWLTLNTYYAGAGSPITVTGHGFGSNELVSVWFNGSNMGTVQTSGKGAFSFSMIVPETGEGTKLIQAVGANTAESVKTTFSQAF